MNDLTLVCVNWNQQPCVELLLRSYLKHHYVDEPLRLMLYDNGSTDGSKEWLNTHGIPFFDGHSNIGHENALNVIFNDIRTKYCLLVDSDIEFHGNVFDYTRYLTQRVISAGELINKNYMNDIKIMDRISPWFWLFNISKIKQAGIRYFRDPKCENWVYDVGSWFWEQMEENGFLNHNIPRKSWNQDNDIISMRYDKFDHWGKVSWDLANHGDRHSEVTQRRQAIKGRLKEYAFFYDFKNKFTE